VAISRARRPRHITICGILPYESGVFLSPVNTLARAGVFRGLILLALLVGTGAGGQEASNQAVPHSRHAFGHKLKVEGVGDFAEVTPTLYRGAQPTPAGFEALAKMGIDIGGRCARDET
jgi:hypothetical protein